MTINNSNSPLDSFLILSFPPEQVSSFNPFKRRFQKGKPTGFSQIPVGPLIEHLLEKSEPLMSTEIQGD